MWIQYDISEEKKLLEKNNYFQCTLKLPQIRMRHDEEDHSNNTFFGGGNATKKYHGIFAYSCKCNNTVFFYAIS